MVNLKDGRTAVLRTAEPGDARATLALARHAIETSEYLTYRPEEFDRTLRMERRLIRQKRDAPGSLTLVAEADGGIVGQITTSRDRRWRLNHNLEFGIVIHQGWQGSGLGRALIECLIGWARQQAGLDRLELRVTEGNSIARALYESLGFVEEGRRKGAIRSESGARRDDVLMALDVSMAEEAG